MYKSLRYQYTHMYVFIYVCASREDYVVAAISQKISGALVGVRERERELVGGNALRPPPRTRKECPTGKPRDQSNLTIAFNALRPTDEKSKR
jgi:hypothetical protein